MKSRNKVYLIGAGPGSCDLLTFKALRVLKSADCIIHDYLVSPDILDLAPSGTILINCQKFGKGPYPMTDPGSQRKITQAMVRYAQAGKRVVRLKNGDPTLFARLSEECEALKKARLTYEIVPGVTAATAAAASVGIPLTDRKLASSVTFVTGHEAEGESKGRIDWERLSHLPSLVFYMGVSKLPEITKNLTRFGRSPETPLVIVEQAGTPAMRCLNTTLSRAFQDAKRECIRPPAVILIGKVTRYAKRYNWSYQNRRILFTGLSEERPFLEENFIHVPMVKICPAASYRRFDKQMKKVADFDWVVFSSRYGVEYFFKRLQAIKRDARSLAPLKIAAVGRSTALQLESHSVIADLVPRIESAEGLLKAFRKFDLRGKGIFLPHSDLSDKGLKEGLTRQGAHVTAAIAYQNRMPQNLPDLDLKSFDEIYFTSPSTVRNFKKRYGYPPKGIRLRAIGGVTERELRRCRLRR